MPQKRVYYYQVRAFGHPDAPDTPAPRVSLHDVMTTVASLDPKKIDVSGRVFKCPNHIDAEHLFMHILKNDPATKRIYGVVGEIRSKNLPDMFDWATGAVAMFSAKNDLLEKSYFLIDTSTGDMMFYQSKNSPKTGLMAMYIKEKCKALVGSFSPEIHFRKDALNKILGQDGKIKSFDLKIKRSAVARSGVLGDVVEDAFKSLSRFSDVDSIGIQLSIAKGKRKGGFALGEVMDGLKKFMSSEVSTDPSSEIEQASFRLTDGEINLLNKRFGTSMYLPDKLFSTRNINLDSLFYYMEKEYAKRIDELSTMGTKLPFIDSMEEPKEDSLRDPATSPRDTPTQSPEV